MCRPSTAKNGNGENFRLNASCAEYPRLEDGKIDASGRSAEDGAAASVCRGFFRAYKSASAEMITEPDQSGRIQVSKIADRTTCDQAMRAYIIAMRGKPELLQQNAGVVILAALKASGLATTQDKQETFYRPVVASAEDTGEQDVVQSGVISDTQGVDFGPYVKHVIRTTYENWRRFIPEAARPPVHKRGRTGIRFKIFPDGSVKGLMLESPSGDLSFDRAAWAGIIASSYHPLPRKFEGPFLELRLAFYYNPLQRNQRQ